MQTLLTNCKIYDGTGESSYLGNILFEDDKILQVGDIVASDDITVIDIKGKSVASGFIDAHSHNDWFAVKKEPQKFFEPFVRQGITSFIAGNCGLSLMGYEKDTPHKDKVGAGLFHNDNSTGDYGSCDEFFNAIDNNTPLNIATMIGHCSTRTSVSGYENRPLSESEELRMMTLLEDGLKQGACGVSLGLMYEPGLYSSKEELRKVAQLCSDHNKPLSAHARALSSVSMSYASPIGRSHILRAMDELVEVTKGLDVKFQYSHAIFIGKKSFKVKDKLVQAIDKMRENGIDAMFDLYSEVCGVSIITVIMPVWYQAMSKADKNKPFNKLKFKILANVSKTLLGFGFSDIVLAELGEGNEEFEGMTVADVAKKLGMKEFDAYCHMCEISNYKGRVNMYQYSTPEIISSLSKHPHVLYMTDSWVEEKGVQNVAIHDCFPKFIHLSLNGTGDTMENTIRKMTGAVSDRYMLKNRGYIKTGYFSDFTIFDENVIKNATPDQFESFGIEKVFVNGKLVLDGNNLDAKTFATSGKAMRV